MEKQKNVPALRFPEYTETKEWDKKELGEVADITKLAGYEYTKHIVYKDTGNIIALRALNIKNNALNLSEVKYIDDSDFTKLQRSKLYIGDLMFTYIGANIGDVALINENDRFYLAPNVARIRANSKYLNYIFILQYFNIPTFLNQEIYSFIASSSQPALSMESIRKFKISLPSLPEQTKIANFLTAIDTKIQQLTQKKALLEQYKKGVMQQLFSQKIRFKDENGQDYPDWEEKRLGDIAEITGGGTPDTSIKKYWNGHIEWFTPTELKSKYVSNSQRKLSVAGVKESSAKILPVGTVLFTSRATVGDVSIALKECTTNQGFQSFIVSKNYNNEFVYYWITKNKKEFLKRASGSTFLEISKNEIQRIKIFTPILKEQIKIANFLIAIDIKIETVLKQIEQTQAYKKGLLQQMFI